jgi:hypothetical protein
MSVDVAPSQSGKNMVLSGISGPKEKEITGSWRTLREAEIQKKIVTIMKSKLWDGGECSTHGIVYLCIRNYGCES